PIGQGTHVARGDDLIENMVLRPISLAGVVHPHSHANQRIESQACCNLELAIPPTNREQLTASGQKKKEQDAKNCEGFVYVKDQPVCKREIVMPRSGGQWPGDRANEYDQR